MARVYYSLAVRHHMSNTWGVEFGAYERADVQDELQQMKDSGEHKAKDLKIICTTDEQSDIDRAIMWLNYHGPALAQMNRCIQ